jgi:hypothetical protein
MKGYMSLHGMIMLLTMWLIKRCYLGDNWFCYWLGDFVIVQMLNVKKACKNNIFGYYVSFIERG